MPDLDVFLLKLEAIAVASRLRRLGEPEHADRVEDWARSQDLIDQLEACDRHASRPWWGGAPAHKP